MIPPSHTPERAGFTLIETIVVVAITAFILVTLGLLLVYFYKTNAYTLEQATAVVQARKGVEDAMRYLREASYGSDGSYPISSAATSSIVFYANVNGDTAVEKITYTVINKAFYRMVATPTGNPPTYAGAAVATSTISLPIVNSTSTPIFRYFNSAGTELATPVDVSDVSSVRTTIVVDVNANRAPTAFTLSGGATLRNLKNSP